jgi:hypothetical protein
VSPAEFGQPGYNPAAPEDSPAYRAHAAQAVGQVVTDPPADAGESVQQMQSRAVPAALSDYEAKLKQIIEAEEKRSAAWDAQMGEMQRQLATVRAQSGPPTANLLASSLATRVQTIANSNPDLGTQHFAGVLSQAASLVDEVKDVAAGNTGPDRAEQLANGITSWFTRVHPRASGKFLEGTHAALDEAERIVEELPNLAPAVLAIATAV